MTHLLRMNLRFLDARRLGLVIGVVLVACLSSLLLVGAEEDDEPDLTGFLFAVRDTPAARFTLAEAREALAAGRTVQALRAIQRVLDTMSNDFYLIPDESTERSILWRSAPEVARELLAKLTPAQRVSYAEMAKPQATPLFKRAMRDNSEYELDEVLRRFGASPVGLKAARLLAERALGVGRWRDAARYAREGLRFAPRDPGLWARLLDANERSGDGRALAAARPPEDVSIRIRGKTVDARAHHASLTKTHRIDKTLRDWPALGGDASRSSSHPYSASKPAQLRARERLGFTLRNDDPPNRSRSMMYMPGNRGSSRLPSLLKTLRPLFPVSEGREIYACDGRSIRAYDLYSGRQRWKFDSTRAPDTLDLVPLHSDAEGRTSLERVFSPVVAGDLVIATMEVEREYESQRLHQIPITTYLPHRVVVALDKKTGEFRWAMGHANADRGDIQALTLANDSVIAPVAVSEGLVIALTSRHAGNHNVSFMAFDLRTGALRWRRSLGSGQQELNLFGYPIKEVAGSTVAVVDGVAYATTGLGFVAAIDIRTGIPRWLASYSIDPVKPVRYWYTAPRRELKVAPSPAMVYGDALIVAPPDGRHIHVYDRTTGVLRWRTPYDTSRMHYTTLAQLVGVAHDGKRDVVLMSDSKLRAFALSGEEQGREVWWGRYDPDDARCTGRGAIANGEVLIPTRTGLQRFSLAGHGKFLGMAPWPQGATAGNVQALGQVLLVSGFNSLQWFFNWKDIERDIAKRRRAHPNDPSILIEAGELFLRGGGASTRARTAFESALKMMSDSSHKHLRARAQEGIFRSWMDDARAVLREDPKKARKLFDKALAHARTPQTITEARLARHDALGDNTAAQKKNLRALANDVGNARVALHPADAPIGVRAYALTQLADLHLEDEEPKKAVDALQEIIRAQSSVKSDEDDMWTAETAIETIHDILDEFGRESYAKHEAAAQKLLKTSTRQGNLQLLDRLLREYPNAEAVTMALLRRSELQLSNGEAEEAVSTLRDLMSEAKTSRYAAPIVGGLYLCYRELDAWGAVRLSARRLLGEFRDTKFTWNGTSYTGKTMLDQFPPRRPSAPKKDGLSSTITLQAPLKEVHFEHTDEDVARPINMEMDADDPDGLTDVPYSLMGFDTNAAAIDMRTGKVAWRRTAAPFQHAVYSDNIIVLAVRRQLMAVDATTGEERWTLPLDALHHDVGAIGGVAFCLHRQAQRKTRSITLVAVDVRKGFELWRREFPANTVRRFSTTKNSLVLEHDTYSNSHSRKRLIVVDPVTGQTRHEIRLPGPLNPRNPLFDGDTCITVSTVRGAKKSVSQRVRLFDLETGKERWGTALKGASAVKSVQRVGSEVYLLRADGHVHALNEENGKEQHQTRIYLGDRILVRPFPRTEMLISNGTLKLVPWTSRNEVGVVCYDVRTGKLRWELPFAGGIRHSYAVLKEQGESLVSVMAYLKNREQHITIRIVDPATGKTLHEIQPEGLERTNWMPTAQMGYGTLVIYGKSGCSIFRGNNGK